MTTSVKLKWLSRLLQTRCQLEVCECLKEGKLCHLRVADSFATLQPGWSVRSTYLPSRREGNETSCRLCVPETLPLKQEQDQTMPSAGLNARAFQRTAAHLAFMETAALRHSSCRSPLSTDPLQACPLVHSSLSRVRMPPAIQAQH